MPYNLNKRKLKRKYTNNKHSRKNNKNKNLNKEVINYQLKDKKREKNYKLK